MKIKKRKIFINYKKEENWINAMAADGWNLTAYTLTKYTFEKGEPGEYDYCIELLADSPTSEKGRAYLEFMADLEIECAARLGHRAYFRKKSTGEPFEIYTDYESRRKHLMRIVTSLTVVTVMNLFFAILNIILSIEPSLSINVNLYIGIVNSIIVIIFTLLLLAYLKNLRELKRDQQ